MSDNKFNRTDKSKPATDPVKVRCPKIECGWSIVWHHFDLLDIKSRKNIKCEWCGTLIPMEKIKGARHSEIVHLC